MNTLQARDRERLRTLAEFRYSLRQFLLFSERRAEQTERLGLRHHSVVELSNRCAEAGLLQRVRDAADRRRVRLEVTAEGHRVLRVLSADHERELRGLLPRVVQSLSLIEQARSQGA